MYRLFWLWLHCWCIRDGVCPFPLPRSRAWASVTLKYVLCGLSTQVCDDCGGRGMKVSIIRQGPMIQQMQSPCGKCRYGGIRVEILIVALSLWCGRLSTWLSPPGAHALLLLRAFDESYCMKMWCTL